MYFFVSLMSRVRKLEENNEIFDKDMSIGNDSLVGRKLRLGMTPRSKLLERYHSDLL